jgi:hypothetical protein
MGVLNLRLPSMVAASVLLTALSLGVGTEEGSGREAKPIHVAVIVNAKNQCPDPTLEELRALLLLERQYWPDKRAVLVILRPSDSIEKQVLLKQVYRLTEAELRKLWTSKLFAGEIRGLPSVARTGAAAASAVRQCEGALSFVQATDVPPGVRVLSIGGKRPGDSSYPLGEEGP